MWNNPYVSLYMLCTSPNLQVEVCKSHKSREEGREYGFPKSSDENMDRTWRIAIPHIRKLSRSSKRQGSNGKRLLPSLFAQTKRGIVPQRRRASCWCEKGGELKRWKLL